MLKRILLFLIVAVLVFPGGASAEVSPNNFVDIQGHWAQQEIGAVSSLGIMTGTGTNEQGLKVFSPDSTVSRSQLAYVLQRTFQLDYGQIRFFKEPLASDYYRDVDNEAWYANGIVMCTINKIFDVADYFYPDRSVSRLEVARAIYRAFNAKGISVPMTMMMPVYADTNSLSQEDINAIVFVSNTGIMKGDGQYFRPDQNMKRAELAKVLNSCVSLIAIDEGSNGKEYQVPLGQTFVISLSSNPTTGFCWNIWDNSSGDGILQKISNNYQTQGGSSQVIAGQGGREYWQFKALKTGTTELKLAYDRPWESVQPARIFTLKVTVTEPAVAKDSLTVSSNDVKNESDTMNVDLNIPTVKGLADSRIQSELNAQFEKDATDLKNQLTTDNKAYVKECQLNNFPIRPYEYVTRYQETYQNKNLLSLYVDYYQYTGGAHGITERRPYNIDLATGKALALKDLFKDNYDYQTVINEQVRKGISSDPQNYFTDDMGFNGITENQNFYLQEGFLVVYFSQYEIAPYASGIPEFKIPLSQFQGGIRVELLK